MKVLITLITAFALFSNTAVAQSAYVKPAVSATNQSLGQEQLNKKNYKEAVRYFAACIEESYPL